MVGVVGTLQNLNLSAVERAAWQAVEIMAYNAGLKAAKRPMPTSRGLWLPALATLACMATAMRMDPAATMPARALLLLKVDPAKIRLLPARQSAFHA
jgi:hypothetical protein